MKTVMNTTAKTAVPALLLLGLVLAACAGTPTPNLEATQQAVAAATVAAQPTDRPVPSTDTPVPSTDTPIPPAVIEELRSRHAGPADRYAGAANRYSHPAYRHPGAAHGHARATYRYPSATH